MPIASYQGTRPIGFTAGTPWDPDLWMRHEATHLSRMHHLPVPASGWVPSLHPSSDAPVLPFGSWINDRPSWVLMVRHLHQISTETKWRRHPNGPVMLDGGKKALFSLYNYLDAVLPEAISAASNTQPSDAPIDTTTDELTTTINNLAINTENSTTAIIPSIEAPIDTTVTNITSENLIVNISTNEKPLIDTNTENLILGTQVTTTTTTKATDTPINITFVTIITENFCCSYRLH